MASFAKVKLSGSTDGRGVKVAATSSPGTTLHTAHATALDEVWLYVYNDHTAPVALTIEFGGVTVPDDDIALAIPSKQGLILAVPGLILTNSLVVKAWADQANKLAMFGFVNRIS